MARLLVSDSPETREDGTGQARASPAVLDVLRRATRNNDRKASVGVSQCGDIGRFPACPRKRLLPAGFLPIDAFAAAAVKAVRCWRVVDHSGGFEVDPRVSPGRGDRRSRIAQIIQDRSTTDGC